MSPSAARSSDSLATHYSWEWPIGVGALLILFGLVSILAPIASTVGLSWVIGAILLVSGIVQVIHALRFAKVPHPGRITDFLMAGLSIVAGAIAMRNPLAGAFAVTAVICFYLLVGGVAKIMMAVAFHPAKGWGFLFTSALVSLVLGVALLVMFPVVSLVVPGVFFGADLIVYGGLSIGFALQLRKAQHARAETELHRAA